MDKEKGFISNDVWIGAILSVLGAVFLAQAAEFPGQSSYFPSAMLATLLVTGLGVLGLGIWKTVQTRRGRAEHRNPVMPARSFAVFLSIAAYVFLIDKIGFFVTSALYLPAGMLLLGQRNAKIIAFTTAACLAGLYFVFVVRLQIHMPRALLF